MPSGEDDADADAVADADAMMQMMNGQNTPIAASSPIYQRQNNNQRWEYQQQFPQSWGTDRPNLHPQAQNFVQSLDAPLQEYFFLDL